LYQVAIRLLVLRPDQVGGISTLEIFRDVLGASAICLFDASTVDTGMSGISRYGLAERTRQAYISGEDADDPACGVFVRCLRGSTAIAGAIGFEGLSRAKTISPALPVLAAQAVERAHAFRRASQETAAAQAEVFRTAILDALAHEFKTPLATILALIGGIRESLRFGPEQEEMAEMIESEVSRLSRLTTRLLRTARLDREELKPRVRRIDVVPFVERVAHRFQAHSRERRVVVDALSTSIEALGDPQLLALALTQLLDNAIKYSLQAGAVTVRVQAEEGSIAISVENEGNPIEPGEQERIFERFYRGARARNLVSGTGLGLYVARKIAAAHGGTLDLVNGAARHGVIFCLKLPAVNHENHALVSSD
jgi:two-component system sensor histidine kinase KdpD